MKSDDELLRFLEKQLERTNYWLSFGEGKNGALLAVNGIIMAAIIQGFGKLSVIGKLGTIVCVIPLLLSIAICLYSFRPNTKSKANEKNTYKDSENLNLLFYGDISKIGEGTGYLNFTLKKYFPQDEAAKSSALQIDMAEEIVINSKIATKKYKFFTRALFLDGIALLVSCLVCFLVFKFDGI